MRKYRLLICSVLLFLAAFAGFWYWNQLGDFFFLIPLAVLLCLLVLFILLLIFSIRRIIKDRSRIDIASVCVLILLVVVVVCFPFQDAKMKYELNRYEEPRLEVVEMIRTGQLRPENRNGSIELPAGYRRLSTGGKVTLFQNDADGQVVGFWILRGLPDDSIILMYSSGGEDLIRSSGIGIQYLEKLKEHWYYVITY